MSSIMWVRAEASSLPRRSYDKLAMSGEIIKPFTHKKEENSYIWNYIFGGHRLRTASLLLRHLLHFRPYRVRQIRDGQQSGGYFYPNYNYMS